jgi:uncharacterized pyridoxamine 5'-phosphate oxidase family protein
MQRVIDILNKAQFGALATVSENKPSVRPFQFQFYENSCFYFCTSEEKQVYKEIKNNSFVEFSAYNLSFDFVRLQGSAIFTTDKKIINRIFTLNPYFKKHYSKEKIRIFYIDHGNALLGNYATYPPEIITF